MPALDSSAPTIRPSRRLTFWPRVVMAGTWLAFDFAWCLAGLRVVSVEPAGPDSAPFERLRIAFNEPVQPDSFVSEDVVLLGPDAVPVPLSRVTPVEPALYEATFQAGTALEVYTLSIGPQIREVTGEPMDQDGDGTSGEPVEDMYRARLIAKDTVVGASDTLWEGEHLLLTGAGFEVRGRHGFAGLRLARGARMTTSEPGLSLEELVLGDACEFAVAGGSTLTVTGQIEVGAEATLEVQSVNQDDRRDGVWAGAGGTILAADVVVAVGGRISADGWGYLERAGPGSAQGASGTHGGRGRANPSSPYGSAEQPLDLGSGGHYTTRGGGAVRLVVTHRLHVDGEISADAVSWGSQGYGSAGGSIWIEAGVLSGEGSIHANGSTRGRADGGGGRVAVYAEDASGLADLGRITASAGGPDGQHGTALLFDTSQPGRHVTVLERHEIAPVTTIAYDTLTLAEGTMFELGGGAELAVGSALTVRSNAVLVAHAIGNAEPLEGEWVGRGVVVRAGDMWVAAGGRVSADGEGYLERAGPGTASSAAGTHGGRGRGNPTLPYGSAEQPTGLGSGGHYTTLGGGAVRLAVTRALRVDGEISADAVSWGSQGYGSAGGSIWIETGVLSGEGSIHANGSTRGSQDGGGGRVAVYFDDASGFADLRRITASSGGPHGQAGTALLFDTRQPGKHLQVYQRHALDLDEDASYASLILREGAVMDLGGGASLSVAGTLSLETNVTVWVRSKDALERIAGAWQGRGATLRATDMFVAEGAVITADGQGYGAGQGPGANRGSMGVHGGRVANSPAEPYGSPHEPTDLGSGGTSDTAGGGAIRLVVTNRLHLDGRITANATTWYRFGGYSAGGSIWIDAGELAGRGGITADGNAEANTGGSGGRLAVYYDDASQWTGLPESGARSHAGNAEHGTAYFVNRRTATTTLANGFVLGENSVLAFPNLTLVSNATVRVGGGSLVHVPGVLRILEGATLVLGGKNTLFEINDAWAGEGCRMIVGDLVVSAGGHISADGQGYAASDSGQPFRYIGSGPGGGGEDGGGGGYGGRGGFVNRGRSYGSEQSPTDLGSGGGGAHSTARGGGAIQVVAGSLTLDGLMTANGLQNDYGWNRGGGSGGSLFVSTGRLTGSGALTANGGDSAFWDGAFTDGGGGGGRVAVYASQLAAFGGQDRSTAWPGTGLNPQAEAGTVRFFAEPEFSVRVADEFCHGTEAIGFQALGMDFRELEVELELVGSGGPTVLAAGLGLLEEVSWDTTTFADGRYELKARFSRDGQLVSQAVAPVVILNDAAWHLGEVAADETWSPETLHVIAGRLHIPENIRVTIAAGAVVKVLDNAVIHLAGGGILEVQGAQDQPSALTSIRDDAARGDDNFDLDRSTPSPALWRLDAGANGTLTLAAHTRIAGGLLAQAGRTLSTDHHWTPGFVYHLTGTTVVPTNITLAVGAGTVVKLDGAELQVQAGGALVASGTPAEPVIFTSLRDDSAAGDSNGDGPFSSPKAGDWRGLKSLGGTLDLTSSRLFYAGSGNESMVRAHAGATVRLRDCQLRYATQEGVSQRDGAGMVSLVNCVIADTTVALHALSGTNTALNCTFVNNATGVLGSGTVGLSLVNTILANGSQYGVRLIGTPAPTIRYCNVWGFTRGAYNGVSNPTGHDGNLATNPFLLQRQHNDFRLNPRSPMIDAADGQAAPEFDHFGVARNDQTNRPPAGRPTPEGVFPDIGAFEFHRNSAPDVDLVASDVRGPATVGVGELISLRWRVTNRGTHAVTGPWYDELSLVADPTRSPLVVTLGEVLVAQGLTLEPDGTLELEAQFRVPGCEPRNYQCEVATDSRAEVYEADRRGNNVARAEVPTAVSLSTIEVDGVPFAGELVPDQPVWLRLLPEVDDHLELTIEFSRSDTIAPLYVAGGYFPGPYAFEQRTDRVAAARGTLRIENAAPQPYYLRIEPERLAASPVTFTLRVSRLPLAVSAVAPVEAGTDVPVTLTLEGQGFPRDLAVSAVTASGVVVPAGEVRYVSSERVLTTLVFNGADAGPADLRLESARAPELLLEDVLAVVSGGAPDYYVEVDAPETLRAGRSYPITIRWGNRGQVDAPLLLLEIRAPEWVELHRGPGSRRVQDRLLLFTTQPGLPRPVMSPGFEGSRTLEVKATQAGAFELTVQSWPVGDAVLEDYPVDWGRLETLMRQPAISDADWGPYWARLKERLGGTSVELVQRLADNAVALGTGPDDPPESGVEFLPAMLQEIRGALADRPRQASASRVARHAPASETGGGQTHALLVSSADYTDYSDNGARDLNAGLTDVSRWETYYTDVAQATDVKTITDAAEWEGWSEDDGDVLGPGQRTGYNSIFPHEGAELLLSAIGELAESAQPGDTIAFHYSGHATADGLQLAERDYTDGYVLPFEDIYAALADTQAEKIIVTLDACKSRGMLKQLETWEQSRLANLAMGTNRFYVPEPYVPYDHWVFLTAADGVEGAYEDPLRGGGLLSQRILTQLLEDDADVTLPEAYKALVPEGQLEYYEERGTYYGAVVSNGLRSNQPALLCTDPDFSFTGRDDFGEGKDELPKSASSIVPDPEQNPSNGPKARKRVESVRPVDPNEKQATGVGSNGYVAGGAPITYAIFFENDPNAGATAPVQELLVTDSLSASLDWSTLELLTVQVGRAAVAIPAGRDEYHDVLQVPNDPYPVFTDVSLDRQTGLLTLWMRSVDPATKDLPLDALAGFLPVNDASGRGQGSLTFRVRPKPSLAHGTVINNQATITFDPTYEVNPPIRTATVRNTLDTQPPTSRVDALPTTSPGRVTVTWSGNDANGSGIAAYDIYAAVDRGPYLPWLKGTPQTSAVFIGELNRTYSFFSVARDRVGNREPLKSGAEAQTTVAEPPSGYDAWLAQFFSPSQIADPALEATLWGELADPDRDARANLVEYFTGSMPLEPETEPLLSAALEQGRVWVYFQRAKDVGDVEPLLEVSTDLRAWAPQDLPVETVQDLGTAWLLRIALPFEGASARFLRLGLERRIAP